LKDGFHTAKVRELRQDRKVATVSDRFRVMWQRLSGAYSSGYVPLTSVQGQVHDLKKPAIRVFFLLEIRAKWILRLDQTVILREVTGSHSIKPNLFSTWACY